MKDSIYNQSGKRIKELRNKKGYTREELSKLVKISPKFLYEIETGNKGFSAQTLSSLAYVLNTSCDYILFGTLKCEKATDIYAILNQFSGKKREQFIKIFISICSLVN